MEYIMQFDELHLKARIRLVAAVVLHRVCPSHTRQFRQVDVQNALKQVSRQTLEHIEDILLFDKRHLAVYLCELRLTVGTQVFVAEAFYYLEITVKAADHQQLLQCLWRLRQGIELTRIHAAWHNEVTRTFRRGVHQHRCLYLQESLAVQVTAYLKRHLMAQLKVLTHAWATQVQITVFHTQVITSVRLIFNRERRCERRVQDIQLLHLYLNLAGRQLRVFRLTLNHFAGHLQHIFPTQPVCFLKGLCALIKCQLGNAITVTQVNKSHSAHFTDSLHPTCQGHCFSYICESQLATSHCSIHIL